jgi:mRNA export factor
MHNESMLVSGSWDNTIKYWDLRQRRCAATIDCKARVFTMDARQHLLVVGTADRCINVLNLNNLTQIFQKFESALKHQTKVVRLFPDLTGFVVGSIEGRCAIQHFQ